MKKFTFIPIIFLIIILSNKSFSNNHCTSVLKKYDNQLQIIQMKSELSEGDDSQLELLNELIKENNIVLNEKTENWSGTKEMESAQLVLQLFENGLLNMSESKDKLSVLCSDTEEEQEIAKQQEKKKLEEEEAKKKQEEAARKAQEEAEEAARKAQEEAEEAQKKAEEAARKAQEEAEEAQKKAEEAAKKAEEAAKKTNQDVNSQQTESNLENNSQQEKIEIGKVLKVKKGKGFAGDTKLKKKNKVETGTVYSTIAGGEMSFMLDEKTRIFIGNESEIIIKEFLIVEEKYHKVTIELIKGSFLYKTLRKTKTDLDVLVQNVTTMGNMFTSRGFDTSVAFNFKTDDNELRFVNAGESKLSFEDKSLGIGDYGIIDISNGLETYLRINGKFNDNLIGEALEDFSMTVMGQPSSNDSGGGGSNNDGGGGGGGGGCG